MDKFVYCSDRFKQVGNDFDLQSLTTDQCCWEAVHCYEQIARFCIMSAHELCECPYWDQEMPDSVGTSSCGRLALLPVPALSFEVLAVSNGSMSVDLPRRKDAIIGHSSGDEKTHLLDIRCSSLDPAGPRGRTFV